MWTAVRLSLVWLTLGFTGQALAAGQLSLDSVNAAQLDARSSPRGGQSAAMLKAQVLLDRAHFSPGAIDGMAGENSSRAIKMFEATRGLKADGKLDVMTWQQLSRDTEPVLVSYQVTKDDVAGPFMKSVSNSLEEMAKLDRLSYTSPLELLAERFHMHRDLLRQLNPGADFGKVGTQLTVANVRRGRLDATVQRVEVDKATESVTTYDMSGSVVSYYPASIGSRSLPSPSGMRKVRTVAANPKYYYRPDLGIRGGPDRNLVVAAGPNNPVGNIWIDLDEPGYGLHGTPDPEDIGKEFSHGCVRLTNWDAKELADMVREGTPVYFREARTAEVKASGLRSAQARQDR
jgi:lipoprotein-anchoring transpeptidase ErfK/SrfK